MKSNRFKWGVVLIVSVILFVIVVLINNPPKSYRETKGPSSGFIDTEGVFKPGGYIKFEFSPEIKSLKGYKKGFVNVYPLYPNNINIDYTVWDETGYIAFGRSWGESMTGSDKSMQTFTIKHKMEIPNEERLAGEEIVMCARYSISYPVFTGFASGINRYTFRNESKNLDEYITILIKDEKFTLQEERHLQKVKGPLGSFSTIIGLASIFFGFYALIRIFFPDEKRDVRKNLIRCL